MAGKAKKQLQKVTDDEKVLRGRVKEAKKLLRAAQFALKTRNDKQTKEIAEKALLFKASSDKLATRSAVLIRTILGKSADAMVEAHARYTQAIEGGFAQTGTPRLISGVRPTLQSLAPGLIAEAIRMLSASCGHFREISAISFKIQEIAAEAAVPRQLPLFGAPAPAEISRDVQISCPRCGRACWQKEMTTVDPETSERRCPGCIDETESEAFAVLARHRELAVRHEKLNPALPRVEDPQQEAKNR